MHVRAIFVVVCVLNVGELSQRLIVVSVTCTELYLVVLISTTQFTLNFEISLMHARKQFITNFENKRPTSTERDELFLKYTQISIKWPETR